MAETAIERFGTALADALRDRGVDPSRPFTVAEIYQDLVPYRTHRDVLGVEMNGDYEHLLLRALAGEGGVLALQSHAALEQIREELESSNPNTGLYREFAAVDVVLFEPDSDTVVGRIGSMETDDDEGSETLSITDLQPGEDRSGPRQQPAPQPSMETQAEGGPESGAPTRELTFQPRTPDPITTYSATVEADPPVERATPNPDAGACQWCRQVLPDRKNLNFCPFCGTDLRIVPCGSCGEALEPGWRFCISCGEEVTAEE